MSDNETPEYKLQTLGSDKQTEARKKLVELYKNSPLPPEHMLVNLGMYMRSSVLAKLLYIDELYQLILDVPGEIVEFGVWWGQNMALFESLRGVYEPYNHMRRIIGFDTFTGYDSLSEADGDSELAHEGAYAVPESYTDYLAQLLDYHEAENTVSHVKKYELVVGDTSETAPAYFEEHPETVVALAYFDMQLYKPTKAALEAVLPHLVRGSVLAIDELGSHEFPGETVAVRELLDLTRSTIRRSRYLPDRTYIVIG